MRSELKTKVEHRDMVEIAQKSGLRPKGGTVVETWIEEDEKSLKIRVQAPEQW